MNAAEKAKKLYRQMVDKHMAFVRVRSALQQFPARSKKDTPQNSPERRLRHICERYERDIAKLTIEHFDAVREDLMVRQTALRAAQTQLRQAA